MPYFDVDEEQEQTPAAEAEARRKVLGLIAGAGKPSVLGNRQPINDAEPRMPAPNITPATPPFLTPSFNTPTASRTNTLGNPMASPVRPNIQPMHEDYPAKPELSGWKKVLGLGAGFALGSAPLVRDVLHGQRDVAERKFGQDTKDWERSQSDAARAATTAHTQAETETLRHPQPQKPSAPHYQTDDEGRLHEIRVGADGKPVDQIIPGSFGKPDPTQKENKAVAGTSAGKPAWGVQTKNGWVDPQTQRPILDFQPPPTFAETG